MDKIK